MGVGAKILEWRRFSTVGGPFRRREGEDLRRWVERLDLSTYSWPDPGDVAVRAVEVFRREVEPYLHLGKFIMCKVLGPTETAESFFSPPQSESARRLGQIYHRFEFGMLLRLAPEKARELYDTIAKYILEVVKACAELEYVDAVRIADDVCTYTGPLYPLTFVKELYLHWHLEYAHTIEARGKVPILHTDGDITKLPIVKELCTAYRGLHPVDLCPKATGEDALRWVERISEFRRQCLEWGCRTVFFTGLPVDLIFRDEVPPEVLCEVVRKLLRLHGRRYLVLATTHRPYPGRGYRDEFPRRKVLAVRRLLEVVG